ncbi:MAG: tRNA (adenosine(37)-N6)-threonylcarbamoyltransferase complex ATPase subunit type 1 TsaE [Planctomycetota bacterium]
MSSEPLRFETHSARETETLGERLARALTLPAIVLFSGELGAGKTAFVRGMLRGLDAPPDVRVTSPTYILLHSYRGGRATLHHIDAYRLGGGADEFEASGLMECFDDPNGIVCIEWPEKIDDMKWPREPVRIAIEHVDPTVRQIVISGLNCGTGF